MSISKYYLLKDEEGYKTVENGELILVSPTTPTEEEFKEKGLLEIPLNLLVYCEGIVIYCKNETILNAKIDFLPREKIVISNKDLSILNRKIKRFEAEGSDNIKILFSLDKGATWRNYIEEVNLSEIREKGISLQGLLYDSKLSVLTSKADYIRFAYYLEGVNFIDFLVSVSECLGKWKVCRKTQMYYRKNDYMTLEIRESGDYKINYGNIQ